MPAVELEAGLRLHYDEAGEGQPLIFLHGLFGSRRAFQKQLAHFGRSYRALALDFRGHGRSMPTDSGHTVPHYASDLRALMDALNLNDAVLVGWSMGALVLWDYLDQFGPEGVRGMVIIDQVASDYKWPDWPLGLFDLPALTGLMQAVQTDKAALVESMIPQFFAHPPADEDVRWLREDSADIPAGAASAILFDQSVRDYRSVLPGFTLPALLLFASEAGGVDLEARLPNARLVVFENARHALHIEHPNHFNAEVERFLASLPG